jgi:hypothetical protein
MKKVATILAILLISFLFSATGNAQLIFKEDFSYPVGTDLHGRGGWIISNTNHTIKVTNPGLTYACYPASNIGNAITITELTKVNLYNYSFHTIIGKNVFTSFMLNVTSAPRQTGILIFHFGNGVGKTLNNVTLFIKKDVNKGFNLGIAKQGTNNPSWTSAYNFDQTYLVVIKYRFTKGPANDQVALYINPDICSSCVEPLPTLISKDERGGACLPAIDCLQSSSLSIDGIRIDTVWCNAIGGSPTLPVELSSFTSYMNGRNVQLIWETKTEKNSDKFVIEKKNSYLNNSDWMIVGSVKGAGLSNSPKNYSFADKNLQTGKYQYRLKMIDNDGSFSYSNVIEIEISLPKTFELNQNYPNPFNPSTKISYNLPSDSRVILEVYNIAGEMVGQLVNNDQPGGYYAVDFNSASLNKPISSGIYFYRILIVEKISGTNFSSIKKMILIK